MHADMSGDEVEDEAEVMPLERGTQPFEPGVAAEFGIERGVIDDVVAVG